MKRLLMVMLLLMTAMIAVAQGAPEQINLALADLNQRLGTSYTLNDINWFWSQETYDDTSLGCPQEGQVYNPGPIVAYRFEFTVGNEVYDYRVSADSEVLVLCSVTNLDEAETTPTPATGVAGFSNPLCPAPPEGITYMPTRLTVGIQARVEPGLPNRLRAQPSTDAEQIGEIPGGSVFGVIQGPVCDTNEGYLWWQVDIDGIVGWTVEGIDGDFFLEPIPGAALPATAPITPENAGELAELSRVSGNFGDALAWSQSTEVDDPGTLVVTGALGSEGVWVYDVSALDETPQVLFNEDRFVTVGFGQTLNLALLGSVEGSLHLWDTTSDAPIVERAFLQGHDSPVSAVAYSADGARFASSGGLAFLREDQEDNLYAISVWEVENVSLVGGLRGHTDTVTHMAFSSDNVTLISGSLDGFIRVWDVALMQNTNTIDVGQPVTAVALHPTLMVVAVGTSSGEVLLYDLGNNSLLASFVAHTGAINALSFNQNGSLLASAGDDSAVQVWDTSDPTGDITSTLLTGHQGFVFDVAFSPDGTLLASLGEDNTLRLWGLGGFG